MKQPDKMVDRIELGLKVHANKWFTSHLDKKNNKQSKDKQAH
jgi:hypothetical protein